MLTACSRLASGRCQLPRTRRPLQAKPRAHAESRSDGPPEDGSPTPSLTMPQIGLFSSIEGDRAAEIRPGLHVATTYPSCVSPWALAGLAQVVSATEGPFRFEAVANSAAWPTSPRISVDVALSLIHISEPTRRTPISY